MAVGRAEYKKQAIETGDKCQVSLNGPPAREHILCTQIDLLYVDSLPFIAVYIITRFYVH